MSRRVWRAAESFVHFDGNFRFVALPPSPAILSDILQVDARAHRF
jgi:hypothetical protein